MNPDSKKENTLITIAVILFIIGGLIWLILSPKPDHIEDTNGPDNYNLQSINEGDVINCKMGSKGGIKEVERKLDLSVFTISNGIEYSSKKFTGVYRLNICTLFKGSDIDIHLTNYEIKSGNFAFYVVFDGEILGKVETDEFGNGTFFYENVDKTGDLEYIIAGESAQFSFTTSTNFN